MRFELTADQRLLQTATADYLEKSAPLGVIRALHDEGRTFDRDTWRRGAELGWTSLVVPEETGGGSVSGEGVVDATVIAEQFGRGCAPDRSPWSTSSPPPSPRRPARTGTPATPRQAARRLDGRRLGLLCAGTGLGPRSGRDRGTAQTGTVTSLTARTTASSTAATRTRSSVLAHTPEGLSQFVVERDADGVSVLPLESLDMVRGFARVDYAGVRVPATALVGAAGGAAAAVERQFQLAVVLQCAELVGVVERVLEFTRQ